MLYVVATPIGNLEDITLRAISTLKNADFILSEDTRVTGKLLHHFEIDTPMISFHEYSEDSKYDKIIELLSDGKNLALVTDAGTPAISDPGYFLVQTIRKRLPEVKISPIPGASAITALVSVSGINMKEFTFLGFPPHKKGRKTFFEHIIETAAKNPVIFYESKHRVIKAIESIRELAPEKELVVGREITKMFEEIVTGTANEILEHFSQNSNNLKGEFVIIIS